MFPGQGVRAGSSGVRRLKDLSIGISVVSCTGSSHGAALAACICVMRDAIVSAALAVGAPAWRASPAHDGWPDPAIIGGADEWAQGTSDARGGAATA